MKKVSIKNNKNGREFSAQLEDPTAWIAEQVEKDSWGKKDLAGVPLLELDSYDQSVATNVRIENDLTVCDLPCEYTITIVDITEEFERERTNLAALKYLAETDWYVVRETETGVVCPAEIRSERAAARLRIVK